MEEDTKLSRCSTCILSLWQGIEFNKKESNPPRTSLVACPSLPLPSFSLSTSSQLILSDNTPNRALEAECRGEERRRRSKGENSRSCPCWRPPRRVCRGPRRWPWAPSPTQLEAPTRSCKTKSDVRTARDASFRGGVLGIRDEATPPRDAGRFPAKTDVEDATGSLRERGTGWGFACSEEEGRRKGKTEEEEEKEAGMTGPAAGSVNRGEAARRRGPGLLEEKMSRDESRWNATTAMECAG